MPADNERADMVVAAFRDTLTAEACKAIGDKGFADLAMIAREALQRERADVAGQFEALAKAISATAGTVDIGM